MAEITKLTETPDRLVDTVTGAQDPFVDALIQATSVLAEAIADLVPDGLAVSVPAEWPGFPDIVHTGFVALERTVVSADRLALGLIDAVQPLTEKFVVTVPGTTTAKPKASTTSSAAAAA